MKYQQLTEGLRYQIACLRDHGLTQAGIANPVSIDERPAIVDERSRVGDGRWILSWANKAAALSSVW
jgi:IS30 family transposase